MVQQTQGNGPIAAEGAAIRQSAASLSDQARQRSEALRVASVEFEARRDAVMTSSGRVDELVAQAAAQGTGDPNAARASLAEARNRLNEAASNLDALVNAAARVAVATRASDPKDEWEECRKTIDRFDKILVDLRKNAFGVIGTVFSAAAVLFGYPQGNGAIGIAVIPSVKIAIFVVVSLLLVSAFGIDRVHQIWLEETVEHAKTLEGVIGFRLTRRISERFTASHAGLIWPTLYIALLFMGWLIFFAALGPNLNDGYHWSLDIAAGVAFVVMAYPTFHTSLPRHSRVIIFSIGGTALVGVLLYFAKTVVLKLMH
jgi:hypothetical protein